MDDREVLQHLLGLENEASALVNDAQAEADRRTAEREKQNRLRYDETYAAEVEVLEKDFAQHLAGVKENCRQQLETYRAALQSMSSNKEAFSSLAEKLMLSAHGSGEKAV
jgi:hypothetical protein